MSTNRIPRTSEPTPVEAPRLPVARRCWLTADEASDFRIVCAAALESSAPHTVLACLTAARLHELWLPDMVDVVHLASAQPGTPGRAMTRTRRAPFVAHRYQLRPQDVVMIHGLPVTSLARTWRDLARCLSLPDLVAAGDSALRAGATMQELADVIDATPNASGAARARRALPLLNKRSRSRPESHLRVAVSGLSVVEFGVNEAVYRDDEGWLAEPDLSLPEAKIALEYQGADHADVLRMRRDMTRFVDLRRANWLVLPYGPAETFGRPDEIRAEVRRELWARAPHLVRYPSRHRNRRRG